MKDMEESPRSVLWLAPRSKAGALLGARFHLREEGSIGPAASCVVAVGARASEALRAALAAANKFTAIALVSPPSVELLDRDVVGRLREIETPILVLFGTDDAASPPEVAHGWRRGLAKCFPTFVYRAGADMANERPEAVASILVDFLSRGEGFLVRDVDDRLYK
jgi:pimeloyl-ACP methyl ester carboxylesterase